MTDEPQDKHQSTQNNDVDIAKLYGDYIAGGASSNSNSPGLNIGIDDIRAYVSVNILGTKTKDLISALNIDPAASPSNTPNITVPVDKAQESRCHAFYRIIGFPVISTSKEFYNPGLDTIKMVDIDGKPIARQINLEDKINIASNIGKSFEDISKAREDWAAQTSKIFSVPLSVEAGVLSLSSGTSKFGNSNLRSFNLVATDPFNFDTKAQSYDAAIITMSGENSYLLETFQDK